MNRVIILLTATLICIAAFAQSDNGKRERIESFRVAYFTRQLNLTAEESQRFWPVYNAYRADKKKLRQNYRTEAGGKKLSADQQIAYDQKKVDLKKQYKPQLEEALGKEKFNQLLVVEDNFKKELIKMLGNR